MAELVAAAKSQLDETSAVIRALVDDAKEKKASFDAQISSFVSSTSELTGTAKAALDDASQAPSALKAIIADAQDKKTAFDNQVSLSISSIGDLVATAKSNLTEIDSSKTTIATIKGAVDEMQRAASSDIAIVSQAKQDVEKLRSEASALSTKVVADYGEVTTKIASLAEQQTALKAVLEDIAAIKNESIADNDAVKGAVTAIAESKIHFDTLNTQSREAHEALKKQQEEVGTQLSEITNANEVVNRLHETLLNDTEGRKSVKSEIDDLQTKISEVFADAKKHHDLAEAEFRSLKEKSNDDLNKYAAAQADRFNDLYGKLQGQILSLLPSAGSAGLATTYYDAKSKYGMTSFHGPVSENGHIETTRFRKLLGHNPTSLVATVFFYLLFLGPMAVIIWLFFDVLGKMSGAHPISFTNQYLVIRTLIALPLATMSLFGYSSLRLYRRLYEEYNYKQRVMELYQSFSKEIETKGDSDQKKALLAIMLKAVADKPSVYMHRYDGISSEGGWKIDIGALLSRFVSSAKPIP